MGRGLKAGEEVVLVVSVDYLIALKEQRYRCSIVQRQEDDAIDRTSWRALSIRTQRHILAIESSIGTGTYPFPLCEARKWSNLCRGWSVNTLDKMPMPPVTAHLDLKHVRTRKIGLSHNVLYWTGILLSIKR